MKKQYRVVRDSTAGYEAQWSYWWYPFWFQCFGMNTSITIDYAKKVIARHKEPKEPKVCYKE